MTHWTRLAVGMTLFVFCYLSVLVWKKRSPAPSFQSFLPVLIVIFAITGYFLSLEKFPIWLDLPLPGFVFGLPALILIPLTRSMERLFGAGERIFSFPLRPNRNALAFMTLMMGVGLVLKTLSDLASSPPSEVAGFQRYLSFYFLLVSPFSIALLLSLRTELKTVASASVYENGIWLPMAAQGGRPRRFQWIPWAEIQEWTWNKSGDLVLTRTSWTGRPVSLAAGVGEDGRERIDGHLRSVLGDSAR